MSDEPPATDDEEATGVQTYSGANYVTENLAQIARKVANGIELQARRDEAWAVRRPDHLDLWAPRGYRDPITGGRQLAPDPLLVNLGRYLRRARRYAAKSQQRVANESGVTQSMVSRAERGLAPGMGLLRLVKMCEPFGRLFPLGSCPHDHDCAWQPIKPPEPQSTRVARLLELVLKTGGVND
jgi:hypothetical protein